MRKIILLLLCLCILPSVFASFCYQESSNTSNQNGNDGNCGLNYSGTFLNISPEGNYNVSFPWYNVNDGDWATYSFKNESTGFAIWGVNYSKPSSLSLNASLSLWQVKDGTGYVNFSIPSECIDDSKNWISFQMYSHKNATDKINKTWYKCYNFTSSDYSTFSVRDTTGTSEGRKIYDESMYWNMRDTPYCYQETANVSTACGGLSNGRYNHTGNLLNFDNVIDGDWTSFTRSNLILGSIIYINYTKISNATTAIWQNKDRSGSFNITIPAECFNNILQLSISLNYNSSGEYGNYENHSCYNGVNWVTLKNQTNILNGAVIYEEAMWWESPAPYINILNPALDYVWYSSLNISYAIANSSPITNIWYTNDSGITNVSLPVNTFNISNMPWPQGRNNVTIYVNQSDSLLYSATRVFYIDSVAPSISITYPSNASLYNSMVTVNYTVSDTNLSSCKWTKDNGVTNTTLANCINITGQTWTQGINNVTIYAIDGSGNENSAKVSFYIDTTYPQLNIVYPSSDALKFNSMITVNYTVSDNNISTCKWTKDSGSTNTTLASCANITGQTWSQGLNTVTIYVNDTAENTNSSTRTFNIDTIPPLITTTFPSNGSVYTYQVTVNYTRSDANIDSCWWTKDSGTTNTTLSNCINITGQTWSQGLNNIVIYINDTYGNRNITNVSFYIDTQVPLINIALPTNGAYYNYMTDINFTISEASLDKVWWSNNSGVTNITVKGLCYQEQANISTACGGLSSGNYNNGTSFWRDGDWSTYSSSSPKYVNYTIPSNAKNTSKWNILSSGTATIYGADAANLSINASCWGTNKLVLRIYPSGTGLNLKENIECNKLGTWNPMYVFNTEEIAGAIVYEESMLWDMDIGNITEQTWPQGLNTVTIYANDTNGNLNSTSVSFNIDTLVPRINITYPSNGSVFNAPFGINYIVSDSSALTCKWSNDTGVTNNTLTDCANITSRSWPETTSTVYVYVNDIAGNMNSSNVTFTYDSVVPVINNTFVNGTIFMSKNITGQFNISDANLYRWNVSIDGKTIDNATNVSYTTYIYNLSVASNLYSVGLHTITVESADSHTDSEIGEYDVSTGLVLSNKIEFDTGSNNILIKPVNSSWFDVFRYEKLTDRYTFSYEPSDYVDNDHYSFIVNTERPLDILYNPNTEYKTWIVTGNNWIDFYSDNIDMNKLKITKLTDYTAKVDVYALSDNPIEFQSIGDLNIITQNFTFYVMNYTITYMSPVIEGALNTINVSVNYTGVPLAYGDINATLKYNNTAYNFTKSSVASIMYFSANVNAPDVNANANIQINVSMSVPGDVVNSTFNQSILKLDIGNCSNSSFGRMITFRDYDEETLDQIMNFSLNIDLFVYTSEDKSSYSIFPFRFSNENNYSICLSPNETTLIGDANMEYYAENYSNRKYFLLNFPITNSSSNLSLYSLLTTQSTDITLHVIEQSTAYQVKDAYVKILRYYPGENLYRTVEIEKTDSNGVTLSKQVLADVWYKYIIEKPAGTIRFNGDIEKLASADKYFYISSTTPTLTTYNQLLAINYNVSCTKSTNTCRFIWSNPTNEPVTGRLTVYQDTGLYRQQVYAQEVTSAAATIAYTITDTTDGKKYIAEGAIIQ